MSVAVVIVSYNSGQLLERCLTALRDQTLQPDTALIVDNHSTDPGTLSLLESLSGVEVEFLDTNLGYGAAINRAMNSLEDHDFLCCVNPDAFAEPRWLEELVKAASEHPEYGSYAPLMLQADSPELIDGAGDVLHFSGIPWRRYHGRRMDSTDLKLESVFSPCAGAALYRMSALKEVGGFDESFFMYVEDVDLWFRLQLAGYACLFVPGARIHHVGSATTGRRSAFTVYHGHRNLVFNYFKNMPLTLLLLTLPIHLLANLVTVIAISLRGNAASIVRAKFDACRMLPAYIRSRSEIPSRVTNLQVWRMLGK